jgi:hypothetical protein
MIHMKNCVNVLKQKLSIIYHRLSVVGAVFLFSLVFSVVFLIHTFIIVHCFILFSSAFPIWCRVRLIFVWFTKIDKNHQTGDKRKKNSNTRAHRAINPPDDDDDDDVGYAHSQTPKFPSPDNHQD